MRSRRGVWLDRLVGYQISPLLWEKVRRGLSAGRVQTVALRLIVEREQEINEFKPVEYWNIDAKLKTARSEEFTAKFVGVDGVAARVSNGVDARQGAISIERAAGQRGGRRSAGRVERAKWSVRGVEKKERRANPTAPYITSKLQQDASSKLGFNVRRTMGRGAAVVRGRGDWQGGDGRADYVYEDRLDARFAGCDCGGAGVIARLGKDYLPAKRMSMRASDRRRRRTRTRRSVRRGWTLRRSRFALR